MISQHSLPVTFHELAGASTCKSVHSAGFVFVRRNTRSHRLEVLLIKRHQQAAFKLPKGRFKFAEESPFLAALRAAKQELGLTSAGIQLFDLKLEQNVDSKKADNGSTSSLSMHIRVPKKVHPLAPQRYIYRSPHTLERLHKTIHYFAIFLRGEIRCLVPEEEIFSRKLREWKTIEMRWLDHGQINLAVDQGQAAATPLRRALSLQPVLNEIFKIFHTNETRPSKIERGKLVENAFNEDTDLPTWLLCAKRMMKEPKGNGHGTCSHNMGETNVNYVVGKGNTYEKNTDNNSCSCSNSCEIKNRQEITLQSQGQTKKEKVNEKRNDKKQKKEKKKKKKKKKRKQKAEQKPKKKKTKTKRNRSDTFESDEGMIDKTHAIHSKDQSLTNVDPGLLKRARAGPYKGPPEGTDGVDDFFNSSMFARNKFT